MMDEILLLQLKHLRLHGLLENWDTVISTAKSKQPSYTNFLKNIVAQEYAIQREKARLLRIQRTHVPERLSIESYPFDKQPKLNRKKVLEIYDSKSYLQKPHNIALIGPTGVGKTGLAISFLLHAANEGYKSRFILFPDLVDELYQAMADHSVKKVLKRFLSYDCLCIDELGYIEIDTQAQAGLIFRLLRQRKLCTIITSNLGFDEWHTFLKNQQLTAALIDKFTSNCHLINMLHCKSITPRLQQTN